MSQIRQEKSPVAFSNNSSEFDSYIILVPLALLENSCLTDEERVTFLHLSRFLNDKGYATCSDNFLAEKRRCSPRKIQENFKTLEDKGFIYRETWKEGMCTKRRIWLRDQYEKYLLVAKI